MTWKASLTCSLSFARETPFATGPEDTPEQILVRIGEIRLFSFWAGGGGLVAVM